MRFRWFWLKRVFYRYQLSFSERWTRAGRFLDRPTFFSRSPPRTVSFLRQRIPRRLQSTSSECVLWENILKICSRSTFPCVFDFDHKVMELGGLLVQITHIQAIMNSSKMSLAQKIMLILFANHLPNVCRESLLRQRWTSRRENWMKGRIVKDGIYIDVQI